VVDAGLAVALAVAMTVAINVSPAQGKPPDALAYGLGLLIAALSLARRRWPLAVLLASAATLLFYNQFDYPGLFSAVPLSVALATAWAAGRRGWALAVAIWFGSTPLIYLTLADLSASTRAQLLDGAVSDLALLAAVLLLGEAVRGRRALDAEHRLLLAERERSEQLLLNVLPAQIAARLKQGEDVIADGFPEVTSCSPTWSTSPDEARRRPRSGSCGSSTTCSRPSTTWPSGTGSRRSRPSATPTWPSAGCPRRGPTTPRRWPRWPWPSARRCPATSTRAAGRWPSASASTPARWWPG